MRRAFLLVLLLACPLLSAQAHDDQARRITSRPEYRGYRVERKPGAEPSTSEPRSDGSTSGDGSARRGTAANPPRRGTGPGGGSRGGGSGGLGAPGWLGGLLEAVAWIVLVVGVGIALFFIVKALVGIKFKGRKKSQKSARKKAAKAGEGESEALPEVPITADEQLFEDALQQALREYQQALANEDYAAATLLAYRIFWLRAGWEGCVRSEDVRTWRDALRMVRAPETRGGVRALLPMVERVRYADYRPRKTEFNTWSLELEKIAPTEVLK